MRFLSICAALCCVINQFNSDVGYYGMFSSPRSRQSGGKVRHKRQALQDMARPLKQWLYKHRDNPYPTKTEKILLALGSQMTLVQVRDCANPLNTHTHT